MEQFVYDTAPRKRGAAAVWSAAVGYLLFVFFLLAGFGGMPWTPYALLVLTVAMLLLLVYGLSQACMGTGSVEVSPEGIRTVRGRKSRFLAWGQINSVRFGGVFHPTLKLRGDGTAVMIYKALPGYPRLWQRIENLPAVSALNGGDVTVRCLRSQHLGLWLAVLVLLIAAGAVTVSLPVMPAVRIFVLVLFAVVAALCVWALIKDNCRYTFSRNGIIRDAFFRKTEYRAADVKDVTLEQAPLRLLVTGYRYRGEVMTHAVQYSAKGLGLRLRIELSETELTLNETQTRFPLELLHKELCCRYGIEGRIVTPNADAIGGQA